MRCTYRFDAAHYAKLSTVTGLSAHELRRLEHDMLQALDQNACVTAEECVRYAGGLIDATNTQLPRALEAVSYVDRQYTADTLPPPFQ
jgi:hypothetical protein